MTDNPDYIRMLKVKKEKELAEAERKRAEREIEIIYEKYAPYLKYDVKRRIKNRQFKRENVLSERTDRQDHIFRHSALLRSRKLSTLR